MSKFIFLLLFCAVGVRSAIPVIGANARNKSYTISSCNIGNNGTLIIFGDSLSDIGSRWHIVEKDPSNFLLPPWFEGRYSTGFMWNEWAATKLDMMLANYAFGGATSSNKFAPGPVPSIQEQVSMFASQSSLERFATPENDIVVVEVGTNDIFTGYHADAFGNSTAIDSFASEIVVNISNVLEKMVSYGFKHFYVSNIPPLSFTPYFVQQNRSDWIRNVISQVNQIYKHSMAKFGQQHPQVRIRVLDTETATATIIEHLLPNLGIKYGSESSCFAKDSAGATISQCTNPDQFFFSDDVHPTRLPQKLMGHLFVKLVQDPGFRLTHDSIRAVIHNYQITDVGQPVVVNEYRADGSYSNINMQIKDQTARPIGSEKVVYNGNEIPYRLNKCG